MSQISKQRVLPVLFFFLGLLMITGCSSSDTDTVFDPTVGHPDDWLPAEHAFVAAADLGSCTECHGADFEGGIANVACDDCHLGSELSVHPLEWDDNAAVLHDSYVQTNGNTSCAVSVCHGANLDGVPNSGPSCSGCHMGGVDSKHPQDWGDSAFIPHRDYVKENGTSACANAACHGEDLTGVSGSGPGCFLVGCHD
jgi:hypothetical protein